jgi:hypothetical protein
MTPTNLGLALTDGKTILAAIQKQMVADRPSTLRDRPKMQAVRYRTAH